MLELGDIIDFRLGSYWVLARIESVLVGDSKQISLKYYLGGEEFTVKIDLSTDEGLSQLRAAGTRSIPFLPRQPVDYLRISSDGQYEQWQRGYVCQSLGGYSSYGGDKQVPIRITSTGDHVLGVTHHVDHTKRVEHEFLVDPDRLAGVWYSQAAPTSSHIVSIPPGSSSPEHRDAGRRGNQLLESTAATTARMLDKGRKGLEDYDLIDVYVPEDSLEYQTISPDCVRKSLKLQRNVLSALSKEIKLSQKKHVWRTARVYHPPLNSGQDSPKSETLDANGATVSLPSTPSSQVRGKGNVYWFEAVADKVSGVIIPRIVVLPLDAVPLIAPAGTYTIPYVVGQRLDCRRIGGLWVPAKVLETHPTSIVIEAIATPKEIDPYLFSGSSWLTFGKTESCMKKSRGGQVVPPSPSISMLESMIEYEKVDQIIPHGNSSSESFDPSSPSGRRLRRLQSVSTLMNVSPSVTSDSIQKDSITSPSRAPHAGNETKRPYVRLTLPQPLWAHSLARTGHYCAADDLASHIADYFDAPTGGGPRRTGFEIPVFGGVLHSGPAKCGGAVATALLALHDAEQKKKKGMFS